jgi:hypothetical protein
MRRKIYRDRKEEQAASRFDRLIELRRRYDSTQRYIAFCVTAMLMLDIYERIKG